MIARLYRSLLTLITGDTHCWAPLHNDNMRRVDRALTPGVSRWPCTQSTPPGRVLSIIAVDSPDNVRLRAPAGLGAGLGVLGITIAPGAAGTARVAHYGAHRVALSGPAAPGDIAYLEAGNTTGVVSASSAPPDDATWVGVVLDVGQGDCRVLLRAYGGRAPAPAKFGGLAETILAGGVRRYGNRLFMRSFLAGIWRAGAKRVEFNPSAPFGGAVNFRQAGGLPVSVVNGPMLTFTLNKQYLLAGAYAPTPRAVCTVSAHGDNEPLSASIDAPSMVTLTRWGDWATAPSDITFTLIVNGMVA